MTPEQVAWLPEARREAAQAWCHDDTQHLELDARVTEHFAQTLAWWIAAADHAASTRVLYQRIVAECALALGAVQLTSDDNDPTMLMLPKLVRALVAKGGGPL